MHACLLHVYDHALLHLLFIVIYHGASVMASRMCNLIQIKTDFRHAYIICSAMLRFAL
jgi:hypothetical protein